MDWSAFLLQRAGLIEISATVGGIGQIFCGGKLDWSHFLQEYTGLAKLHANFTFFGST